MSNFADEKKPDFANLLLVFVDLIPYLGNPITSYKFPDKSDKI